MIFYIIGYGERILDWAGTQAEAKAATKALQPSHTPVLQWAEHDVPTSKPELLAWLKVHALGEKKVIRPAEPNHPAAALPFLPQHPISATNPFPPEDTTA